MSSYVYFTKTWGDYVVYLQNIITMHGHKPALYKQF